MDQGQLLREKHHSGRLYDTQLGTEQEKYDFESVWVGTEQVILNMRIRLRNVLRSLVVDAEDRAIGEGSGCTVVVR